MNPHVELNATHQNERPGCLASSAARGAPRTIGLREADQLGQ